MTHDELIPVYEYLQSCGYGTAQMDTIRAEKIYRWIEENIPPPARVLDASCGRGHLLKMLLNCGYEVEGTEASKWLIDNVLSEHKVRHLRYDRLKDIDDLYDVVVSNDVLEHLINEAEVEDALFQLSIHATKYLCISVGLNDAKKQDKDNNTVRLHHVIRTPEWWMQMIGQFAHVIENEKIHNSFFMFCEA